MRILVFNSGSSSLKFQMFGVKAHAPVGMLKGTVRGLGTAATCEWVYDGHREQTSISVNDHDTAARSAGMHKKWKINMTTYGGEEW